MSDRSQIITPYSPLDGVFSHYNDQDGSWKGDYFVDRRSKKRFRGHPWNVQEIEKTAEINDHFGFIRFKVYLYVSDSEDRKGYEVSTTSFMYNNEENTIFTSDVFDDLHTAQKCYDENVEQYSMIAKVETQHYQDIKIYAEKIGYRRVFECCGNCRWCEWRGKKRDYSHMRDEFGKEIHYKPHPQHPHHHGKLVCTNHKLFEKRIRDLVATASNIEPEVNAGCVCDSFEKRLPPNDPSFKNHCYDQYGDELDSSKTED